MLCICSHNKTKRRIYVYITASWIKGRWSGHCQIDLPPESVGLTGSLCMWRVVSKNWTSGTGGDARRDECSHSTGRQVPMTDIDVLLCYRGRFLKQVTRLDELLTQHGLAVTFDREILQPGVEYGDAEIEWLSLSDDDEDDNNSWCGPLSAAVNRSKLIVFLIDTQDPSVNVINEIAWTARSSKALFVVFNTQGEGHSLEWEGIQVGMIQALYGITALDPEVPAFGYHFVTHETDEGLDERLTILANRIISYFDKVQRGEVETIRIDNETTLSDVENAPPARARHRLHDVQQRIAQVLNIEAPLVEGDQLQNALASAHQREQDGEVRDGRIYPKNSPFTYPEASERERYRRTEELIESIRPGPFENPYFLEMLARELVSVEMVLDEPMSRSVLLGTIPSTPSDVPGDVIIEPDYAVLIIDATLQDFVYQMLKVTVMSWKITTPPGVLPVSMSSKVEDTREVITEKPELILGFVRSLVFMLNEGKPASSTDDIPPQEYHPALSMLGVYQKRFTIAVALARMTSLDMMLAKAAREGVHPPAMPSEEWILAADLMAASWVFDSANVLDGVDPTIALHGISLALASYDLIERSLTGFRPPELIPASTRLQNIEAFFEEYLVVRQVPRDEAKQRRDSVKKIVVALDFLLQEATESGVLDIDNLEPSPRWKRHIRLGSGNGANGGGIRRDSDGA